MLEQEGLNYFLFAKDARILDVFPYSPLFDPVNIADNLAIKWTDGNTYLLTWKGRGDTRQIGADFLDAYTLRLHESAHPWFRFKDAIPELDLALRRLSATTSLAHD